MTARHPLIPADIRCDRCAHYHDLHADERIFVCLQMANDYDSPSLPGNLARAFDAEMWSAHVAVQPDFGCVMFQEHPSPLENPS